jgi:DNA-binding IscR family transcriptional regulator
LRVVEAVDGEIFLNDCVHLPDSCDRRPICPVHRVWGRACRQLRGMLDGIHLAQLVEEESRAVEALSRTLPMGRGQTLEGKGE